MNYLWELVVKANQQQLSKKQITYCYPQRYSPYLELNFEHLNTAEVEQQVEINPYYRYSTMFRDMFLPDDKDNQEIKEQLFDLLFHYIGALDANRGMNKREYQIQFVKEDIANGLFGSEVTTNFTLFTASQQSYIASNILRLYKTNEGVLLFKEAIKRVYPKAIIFVSVDGKDELTVFLQVKETSIEQQKIAVLKDLFLPFKFHMTIYFEHLFGIIGEPEFMKIQQMVIY